MTGVIGRSYARALFELARETATLDAVEEDLRVARRTLHDDRTARDFLANRLIARATKKAVIRSALEAAVDGRVLTLLFLMADRGRLGLLGEVVEEFERLARLARGVREVRVASAFPLDAADAGKIARSLEKHYGDRVELVAEVQPELIGGVVAQSEGQEIDLSLAGRLRELRERLAGREGS